MESGCGIDPFLLPLDFSLDKRNGKGKMDVHTRWDGRDFAAFLEFGIAAHAYSG